MRIHTRTGRSKAARSRIRKHQAIGLQLSVLVLQMLQRAKQRQQIFLANNQNTARVQILHIYVFRLDRGKHECPIRPVWQHVHSVMTELLDQRSIEKCFVQSGAVPAEGNEYQA